MQEIVLQNKKHGMLVLLLSIFFELLSIAGIVFAAFLESNDYATPIWGSVVGVSVFVLVTSWVPMIGLRVLKPNEALVLIISPVTFPTL